MIDASWVYGTIFVGSLPPTGSALRREGFDVLVLCAEEYQPRSWDVPGVKVIHAPIDDGELPRDQAEIAMAAGELVAKHAKRGDRVLVTCAMGRNRSALIAALAIHMLTGMPGRQAGAIVRSRRKDLAGIRALSNQRFVSVLNKL